MIRKKGMVTTVYEEQLQTRREMEKAQCCDSGNQRAGA